MKNIPCPICYVPMKVSTDYIDGHTLIESEEICKYGCYHHHYAYGYTEVAITICGQRIVFHHSYMDSPVENMETWGAIQQLFEPARAALIEDLRKGQHYNNSYGGT